MNVIRAVTRPIKRSPTHPTYPKRRRAPPPSSCLQKMEISLGVLAFLSLLAASTDAQDCERIAASDLGSSSGPAEQGLIAERLSLESSEPVAVQLLRFHIVCEVIGLSEGRSRQVSLVADYSVNDVTTSSQFEFVCNNNIWELIPTFRLDNTVTTPPTATFATPPRTDCINCLSPNRAGSNTAGPNHCEGKVHPIQREKMELA